MVYLRQQGIYHATAFLTTIGYNLYIVRGNHYARQFANVVGKAGVDLPIIAELFFAGFPQNAGEFNDLTIQLKPPIQAKPVGAV